MQRIGGLLLMLAGVSLGAYTFLPPPMDGEETLREVTRISAAPDREARSSASPVAAGPITGTASAPEAAAAGPIETGAISIPSSTWSAIVTSEASQQARMTSSKPGDDETRAQLTRDLQSELKRVGCYAGEVSGNWTPSTKRAMSAFIDRVNATLPIEEPDYILLTLVQGHATQACGAGCPAGQVASGEGRCVPQAVVAARSAKKPARSQDLRVAEDDRKSDERRAADELRRADADQRKADQQRAEQLRLADAKRLADQRQRAAAQEQRRVASAAKAVQQAPATATGDRGQPQSMFVAETGKERLPWQDDDLSRPAPQRVPRPEGMMSVGGPQRIAKAEVETSSEAVSARGTRAMPPVPVPVPATRDGMSDRGSAAPVLQRQVRPPVYSTMPRQGLAGSKSGPAVQQGLPGSKSGVAIQRKAAASALYQPVTPQKRNKTFVVRRGAQQPAVFAKPKPKFYFYASKSGARRDQPRPGSPAYNMLQAMGGIY